MTPADPELSPHTATPLSVIMMRAGRRLARYGYGRLMQRRQIASYFSADGTPLLNIGCGANVIPGWMNVDLAGGRHGSIFMDLTNPWPLPDNKFHAILCEHMIEHVSKPQARHLLNEAFRVLKHGGHIRIVTPDLASMADLVLHPQRPCFIAYLDFVARLHGRSQISAAEALNYMFYDYGHQFIYTMGELVAAVSAVGFSEVITTRAGHPLNEVFQGTEGHPAFMGLDNDATEAFALEAVKPPNA